MDHLTEKLEIPVLDMPAILTQMNDNPVCTSQFHQYSRGDRIRILAASGLTDGRDVGDVDAESRHMTSV
jgi:hypothetical protein